MKLYRAKLKGCVILGIFFKDYESAGSGISKDAPKKEGIALFFDLLGRKFWKLLGLNVLYYLFFIPLMLIIPAFYLIRNGKAFLITAGVLILIFMVIIGPATAGMMKIMRSFYIEKHTFIVRDFFKAFKANFKKAAIVGFIDCLIILSAFASLYVYPVLAHNGQDRSWYIPMVITLSLFLTVLIMNFYIFLMMVATNLSFKDLLKNSFALAFAAPKQNGITFGIAGVLVVGMFLLFKYLTYLFNFIFPVFPAAFIAFVVCFNCYPVIQKFVINPYYTSIGEINPELVAAGADIETDSVFTDMGGKEAPVEKKSKGKGRHIS